MYWTVKLPSTVVKVVPPSPAEVQSARARVSSPPADRGSNRA